MQTLKHAPSGTTHLNAKHLIKCVKEYPLLYNTEHPEYNMNFKKVAAWSKIGAQLNSNATKCKLRWYSLRDGYRKSLRKKLNGGKYGWSNGYYRYDKDMAFLKPYLRVQDDLKGDDQNDEDHPEPDAEISETASNGDTRDNIPDVAESLNNESVFDKGDTENMLDIKTEVPDDFLAATAEPMVEYPLSSVDPIDAFLYSIGATLKSLPAYYLELAKADIFAAAHKYKMRSFRDPMPTVPRADDDDA